MKIDRDAAVGRNVFTGYGEGYVEVNGRKVAGSVIVTGEQVLDWNATDVAALAAPDLDTVLALKPEIILLGTGTAFAFPEPAALAGIYRLRVGFEVMDTKAACRTYNILLGEGRNVVAALLAG